MIIWIYQQMVFKEVKIMKIWIRTQDKKGIYEVERVFIDERLYNLKGKYGIQSNNALLGDDDTMERALEVLDDIESHIEDMMNKSFNKDVYQMPQN